MNKFVKIALVLLVIILVISAVLRVLTNAQQYVLVSSNISSEPFKVFSSIDFTFNKTVTEQFLKSCIFNAEPVIKGSFVSDGNTLRFQPQSYLEYATNYQAQLTCPNITYQATFVTQSIDQLTPADQQTIQTKLDYDVANEFKKMAEEQPWRIKLPLQQSLYDLYYSQEQNKYFVYINPAGVNVPKAEIEKDIQTQLQNIGAPELPLLYR